jgi:YjbE family integral membrane protein
MDLFGSTLPFPEPFFVKALFSIIVIDIVLAGDNAVVIAMAVQSLERKNRMAGIVFGSSAAVLLRIVFTFFAARLLAFPLVKFSGGVIVIWIAVKLLTDKNEGSGKVGKAASIRQAVWTILVADVAMSIDNILAVAGASHGNLLLLVFGFGLSIPLVVFASALIANIIHKFPIVVWFGAALIGSVGGGMIINDGIVVKYLLAPLRLITIENGALIANHHLALGTEILAAAAVLLAAVVLRKIRATNPAKPETIKYPKAN